jgi:hypothetical protein
MLTHQTKQYTFQLAGLASVDLVAPAAYYLINAADYSVTIRRDTNGSALTGMKVNQGEAVPFNRLTITNENGNTNNVTILVGEGHFIDRNTVIGTNSVAQGVATPTNRYTYVQPIAAAATATLALAKRQFVALQNLDPAVAVWFAFGMAAQINVAGMRLLPGEYWETGNLCPPGSVSLIGEANCTANVVIWES